LGKWPESVEDEAEWIGKLIWNWKPEVYCDQWQVKTRWWSKETSDDLTWEESKILWSKLDIWYITCLTWFEETVKLDQLKGHRFMAFLLHTCYKDTYLGQSK
jgi:hypothetical protein